MRVAGRAMVHVNANFGSGNIEVVEVKGTIVDLKIRPDPYCEGDKTAHFQWFYFRVSGAAGQELSLNIVNAGEASYLGGWPGYSAVASYDRKHWFRVPTQWKADTGCLTIKHQPAQAACFYAYFAPYTWEQHLDLVAEVQMHPDVTLHTLCQTLDGRDLDLLQIGRPGSGKPKLWMIARQHPGESMAEWFVEGFLRRLLDPHDPLARLARTAACFYVVPNMNPDGSIRGHLRTNAGGANLNREWCSPTAERSPEVLAVRNYMDELGLDFLADIHGDESVPHNYIIGSEGIPSYDQRLDDLHNQFADSWLRCSPDFQTKEKFHESAPGQGNLKLCQDQIAERFRTLVFTLEMPFKDTSDLPDPVQGWSPERSLAFGASVLQPIMEIAPKLR